MTVLRSVPVSKTSVCDSEMSEMMTTLLRHQGSTDPVGRMTVGHVIDFADDAWWVVVESGERVRATVAVSCLVKPKPDDLVHLYRMPGRCWVLAILERHGESRDVALDFGSASVRLHAQDVEVHARDRVHIEAAHLESRASVVTQTAKERHAHVSGTDATHAGNAFVHAERHMSLHAKSAVVKSESLLKMDAGQIHMG